LAAVARVAFVAFFFADAAPVVFLVAFFLAITSPRPRTRVPQAH
jgi:hypothetical protein